MIMYTNTSTVHMGIITHHSPLYEGNDQVVMAIQTFIIPLHSFNTSNASPKLESLPPTEVMKLIRCQCHALSKRCEGQCSCKEAGLRRTSFCGCNDDVPGFKTLQMTALMLMMILKIQSTIVIVVQKMILMTCDLLKLNVNQ